MSQRPLRVVPTVAVLLAMTVLAACSGADRKKAPVLEGEGLAGRPLSTADFAGKTVVVNLWGPWCAPCLAEAPELNEVATQYADKGVQFVGILTRSKDPSSAIAFNRNKGIVYPSFKDEGGKLELGFNDSLPTLAIPTTWIIDSKGRVAARVLDKVSASTLANLIDDVQKSTA
jgi:thiol-disulfide isomerase/thioredoxin